MDFRKLGMRSMSREEVASATSPDKTLIIIGNKVYEVAAFAKKHPGGSSILLNQSGKDATAAFERAGHSMYAKTQMNGLLYAELSESKSSSSSAASQNGSTLRPSDFSVRTTTTSVSKAGSKPSNEGKVEQSQPMRPPSVPTLPLKANLGSVAAPLPSKLNGHQNADPVVKKPIPKHAEPNGARGPAPTEPFNEMLPDLSELQQPSSIYSDMTSPRRQMSQPLPSPSTQFGEASPISLARAEPATCYVNRYGSDAAPKGNPDFVADAPQDESRQFCDSPSSLRPVSTGADDLEDFSNGSRAGSVSPHSGIFDSDLSRNDQKAKRPVSPRAKVQKSLFKLKCSRLQRGQHIKPKEAVASPAPEPSPSATATSTDSGQQQLPSSPVIQKYPWPVAAAAPPSVDMNPTPNGVPKPATAAAPAAASDCNGSDCENCPAPCANKAVPPKPDPKAAVQRTVMESEAFPKRMTPPVKSTKPMSSYNFSDPAPPARSASPPPPAEPKPAAPAAKAMAAADPMSCPHVNGSSKSTSSDPNACPFAMLHAAMEADGGAKKSGSFKVPGGAGDGLGMPPPAKVSSSADKKPKDKEAAPPKGDDGVEPFDEVKKPPLTKTPSIKDPGGAPSVMQSQTSGSSATGMTRGSSGAGGRRGRKKVLRSKAPHCDMAALAKYVPVIKNSWAKVVRSLSWDALGDLLYRTLFDEAEELRGMFFNLTQAQSIRFVDMLSSIFDFAHSPEKMHEKMESMGAMHHTRGVQPEHMVIMQRVIMSMLSVSLRQEFTTPVREAWTFLWEYLTRSMAQVLESFGGQSSIVQDSWDSVLSKFSNLEVGGFLYDTLFELAPNLQTLFKRPKDVIALKFVEMISMLVSFSGDKERMRVNITWLGFRHVRYGVRPHHIPIMGQVLMAVLEKALGGEWSEAMANAWGELWTQTCEMMRRAIDDGEQKGSAIIEAWNEVRRRTTPSGFGSMVYTKLLKYTTGTGATDFAESLSEYRASGGGPSGGKAYDRNADVTGSEALGAECWDLMTVLTDRLYDPDEQIEVLTVRGAHYYEMGLKSADLVAMGQAIHDSIQEALGPGATPKTSEASRWLWQVACISLGKSLKNAEEKFWEVVQADWTFLRESVESASIGETFYTELGEAAPEMIHLFARPKNIQSNLFVQHLDAMINMAREPAKLIDDVRAMTVRHIKYGAKPEDVVPFATTFTDALARLMGERWTDRSRDAWGALWEMLTTCMARCLRAGSSPITIALVQGDLNALKVAIAAMPRSQREECLLKIEINGAVESPLYWAVHDGHVELARYMLRDLLTIRADRDRYYYGLDALMAMHGDLVRVLCRKGPALLDDLFNGLLWTSKSASTTEEGIIRVNYYVRDLYGDPKVVQHVWDGPMAVLCLEGPISAFLHPVVLKVLHVKWQLFGRALFLLTEAWYSGLLLLFMLGFIVLHDRCDAAPARTAAGALAGVTLACQIAVIVRQANAGQMQRVRGASRGAGAALPHWLRNAWNLNRMVSMVLIILGAAGEHCYKPRSDGEPPVADPVGTDFTDIVVAVAGVLLWMGMLEILTLSTRLSAFTYSIGVLAADMARNFIVIGVLLLSFASALVVVERAVTAAGGVGIPGFETLGDAVMSLISLIIVLTSPVIEGADAFAVVALVAFACLANIGMLNILIAQLTLSFESISRDKRAFAMAHRARVCVEMEDLLPRGTRQRLFDSLGFDKPLEFDRGDVGVPGGLQALESVWSVRADPRFVPDRIRRYPGEADKESPWPDEDFD